MSPRGLPPQLPRCCHSGGTQCKGSGSSWGQWVARYQSRGIPVLPAEGSQYQEETSQRTRETAPHPCRFVLHLAVAWGAREAALRCDSGLRCCIPCRPAASQMNILFLAVCVGFQAEHLTECPRTRPQFHLKWGWAVGYEDRAATEQVRKMEGECFDFCLVVCFLF